MGDNFPNLTQQIDKRPGTQIPLSDLNSQVANECSNAQNHHVHMLDVISSGLVDAYRVLNLRLEHQLGDQYPTEHATCLQIDGSTKFLEIESLHLRGNTCSIG